ncbi:hypothetical protein K438DRAFT_1960448 [Mycena galopus ATCC 62051]|nr:hypothetical protein K438DRAFT_1960448 [Mycena galopus ATCC 62051]
MASLYTTPHRAVVCSTDSLLSHPWSTVHSRTRLLAFAPRDARGGLSQSISIHPGLDDSPSIHSAIKSECSVRVYAASIGIGACFRLAGHGEDPRRGFRIIATRGMDGWMRLEAARAHPHPRHVHAHAHTHAADELTALGPDLDPDPDPDPDLRAVVHGASNLRRTAVGRYSPHRPGPSSVLATHVRRTAHHTFSAVRDSGIHYPLVKFGIRSVECVVTAHGPAFARVWAAAPRRSLSPRPSVLGLMRYFPSSSTLDHVISSGADVLSVCFASTSDVWKPWSRREGRKEGKRRTAHRWGVRRLEARDSTPQKAKAFLHRWADYVYRAIQSSLQLCVRHFYRRRGVLDPFVAQRGWSASSSTHLSIAEDLFYASCAAE